MERGGGLRFQVKEIRIGVGADLILRYGFQAHEMLLQKNTKKPTNQRRVLEEIKGTYARERGDELAYMILASSTPSTSSGSMTLRKKTKVAKKLSKNA